MSSCAATDWKSNWVGLGRAASKFQFADESNVIIPPHGPKSVLGVATAPVWPRPRTRFSHAWVPVAVYPPDVVRPSSPPPSLAPPRYTTTSFAATVGLSIRTVAPVAGLVERLGPRVHPGRDDGRERVLQVRRDLGGGPVDRRLAGRVGEEPGSVLAVVEPES